MFALQGRATKEILEIMTSKAAGSKELARLTTVACGFKY